VFTTNRNSISIVADIDLHHSGEKHGRETDNRYKQVNDNKIGTDDKEKEVAPLRENDKVANVFTNGKRNSLNDTHNNDHVIN